MQVSKKARFIVSAKKNFISGLFVGIPLFVVFWILLKIWFSLNDLASLLPDFIHPKTLLNLQNPIAIFFVDVLMSLLMFFLLLLFIWWLGIFSRNYLGKQTLSIIRNSIIHIPVLRTVYSTLEQLLETFSGNKNKNFRQVIEIEFPRKGLYTIALVTGEKDGMITAYVPTTPNPTGGYYVMIPKNEVKVLDMSVEEALKEIISMGLVTKKSNEEKLNNNEDNF
jgi:uncharacterized membrane protein